MSLGPVNEFVFFRLKPSVKPEDPDNLEGDRFLDVLRMAKNQSEYMASAWGRTKEDENNVVLVTEWSNSKGAIGVATLTPFLDPSREVIIIYATLNPPALTANILSKNPVTEIIALAFPSSMTAAEHMELDDAIGAFRVAMLEHMPEGIRAQSWSMGYIDRPGTMEHPNSPSGKALVLLMAIGWDSVEAHMTARKTSIFAENISPIRQRMLPPLEGLEMKHVSFTKI